MLKPEKVRRHTSADHFSEVRGDEEKYEEPRSGGCGREIQMHNGKGTASALP